MKFIWYLFLLLLFTALLVVFGAVKFFFHIDENGWKVKDENKPMLKEIARTINKIIYKEATEHNPEGDVVPDEIDDFVKKKIKSLF